METVSLRSHSNNADDDDNVNPAATPNNTKKYLGNHARVLCVAFWIFPLKILLLNLEIPRVAA